MTRARIDELFGAVIANHMLYDVPGRQRAFAEIRRVLKPGEELYATTNGFGRLLEMQDLMGRVKPEASIGPNEPDDTPFRLETGEEQLASWFEDIQVRRLERELIVTEVEPLVGYVQSAARTRLDAHQESEFRLLAKRQISSEETIRIATTAGMFVASKGGKP